MSIALSISLENNFVKFSHGPTGRLRGKKPNLLEHIKITIYLTEKRYFYSPS